MRILMLGGSSPPGGVEAFCEYSRKAITRQCDWQIWHAPTDTSYLTLTRIPGLLKRLVSLIPYRRKRIDCVWLQYACLPDLAYLLAAKLCGFTVMVTPHLGSNWRSQSNSVLRGFSRVLLSFADRLALISRTQEFELCLPTKVPRSYIRNFLPEPALIGDISDGQGQPAAMRLIHAARLSEGKGTFLFLDVCRSLQEAGVPFHARLAGGTDGGTYARIHELIDAYDLQRSVAVLGHVPKNELLQHLRNSDLLIHLSTIDSYPLIVLESIACSTFPICINLAGAADMVKTYIGHVVDSREPVAQTVAFLRTQRVRDIRALCGEAALRVRDDYAWAQSARAVRSAIIATVQDSASARAGYRNASHPPANPIES